MTMQMQDAFTYRGERAEAIALSRRFSFSPANNLGIATAAWATSNYRGFWCDYSIDESLVIDNLYLFSKEHHYPPINGRAAEEIPECRHLLDIIHEKSRTPKQYRDCFPMRYVGIHYNYEYSGKIVLGVDPKRSKSGRKSYRQVKELVLDKGIVMETTDITDAWRQVDKRQENDAARYWWEQADNDYYNLINYGFMGVDEPPDSKADSG